jgi:sugar/nucleoside kinase (ribokinase family)
MIFMMDLLSIGGITFDNLFWVNRLPKMHFEGIIEKQGRFFGGRAPNVAVGVSKLGLKTGLVSAVGKDFESEGYADYLRVNSIDFRGIVSFPDLKTKQLFIFTDPKGNQITFFDYGAEQHFKEMRIPKKLIGESKTLYISSSGDYTFNMQCAKQAHDKNRTVFFDPGNDPFTEVVEYMETMLRNSTVLLMNNLEADALVRLLGAHSPQDFLDYGPTIVVMINKKNKASIIYTKNLTENIPSSVKSSNDPTGASDGYVSGFIAGFLKGCDIVTSGKLGAVEASFVAENFGAQTNLPNWETLCNRAKVCFKELASIS